MPKHAASASHANAHLLARDIEKIILRRVAEGRYLVGDRLPSCESFGREIGANKNTVNKAYRALSERGYLTASPGRGTVVTARPAAGATEAFLEEIGSLLTLVVENAYAAGISGDELEKLIGSEIRRRYDRSRLRVAFVECNLTEATKFSRQLEGILGTAVEPLLLDDLLTDTQRLLEQFDVIAVDLSHLADAQKQLQANGAGRAEIVPLLTLPDPETLAEVARLTPNTHLGVLTETPEGLGALSALVRAFNPALRFSAALVRNHDEFAHVVKEADVLLVTEAVRRHVDRDLRGKPLIEAPFKLDRRSVEQLAQQIADRRRAAATA